MRILDIEDEMRFAEEKDRMCPYSTYAHICIPNENVAACKTCSVREQTVVPAAFSLLFGPIIRDAEGD